jgi:hypothetical protein
MVSYIDGTTGGLMLQIVMAGLVGGFVAIKVVTKSFFAGLFRRGVADDADEIAVADEEVEQRS